MKVAAAYLLLFSSLTAVVPTTGQSQQRLVPAASSNIVPQDQHVRADKRNLKAEAKSSKSKNAKLPGYASKAKSSKSKNAKPPETCGMEEGNECIPSMTVRNSVGLQNCLEEKYDDTKKVTIIEYLGESPSKKVLKITFPEKNYTAYAEARYSAGYGRPRLPAGIFYAEDESEVVAAVNCAREAGYKISPRGRGHSYQALSNMDGYLVIDMSLVCNPEDFIVSDEVKGRSWILGDDQKLLGSVKSGAGCTNAVMLAYTTRREEFAGEKGGVMLIGSCPSVGIAGYATGGGQGDTTPWVGLGVDDVLSYDIVLYNGTSVTASRTEHTDLYWYLRGGGSGIGVITQLETAIVQSPDPEPGSDRKFTAVTLQYSNEEEKVKKFITRFQDFLVPPDLPFDSTEYKNKIKKGSARFGGAGSIGVKGAPFKNTAGFLGHFLGSEKEAKEVFDEYGLLDPEILVNSTFYQGNSYGDTQAYLLCMSMNGNGDPTNAQWPYWTAASLRSEGPLLNVCDDLGIDSEQFCDELTLDGFAGRLPKCDKPTVIEAIVNASLKPQSFMNRPGYELTADYFEQLYGNPIPTATLKGGLLMPRLEPDVLLELAKLGISIFHLAHGAPTLIAPEDTGYANREEFWLLAFDNADLEANNVWYNEFTSILTNKVYGGDPSKIRGFYNYVNPLGNPNWREYYWGDNYERLSEIKLVYDETNGFGNPVQVEPAIPGKKKKNGKSGKNY